MSSSPTPAPASPPVPSGPKDIRIISHSTLFYWWPIWFFGFIFTIWTYFENNRLAIVPNGSAIEIDNTDPKKPKVTIEVAVPKDKTNEDLHKELRLLVDSKEDDARKETRAYPKGRISTHAWMGPLFFLILILVIFITNVPLRGLWSLVAVIGIVVLALVLSLFDLWDKLLTAMGDLHIYINMAGYLTLSTALFIGWVLAVKLFDNRTYIIFTPGQIKVCEEIGGREKVYDTTGMAVEKKRDDWFRHIVLGFGTGDLIVRTAGADRHEIEMPNVAFIGFKIGRVEQMLRQRQQHAV